MWSSTYKERSFFLTLKNKLFHNVGWEIKIKNVEYKGFSYIQETSDIKPA